MLAKILTGTTFGLQGILVEIEVDVAGRGFPTFTIVGLPGKSIDESKERVRTAITNAGYEMPDSRITVNLAPADIPKSGSSFDLAIALGILSASKILPQEVLNDKLFIGELSLKGNVRPDSGIIPLILMAQEKEIPQIYVPVDNAPESALFDHRGVHPVISLKQLIAHLMNEAKIDPYVPIESDIEDELESHYDLAKVKGQEQAKRALEIAAAGFHNIHLKGPPGAGKTLLSRSMPTILPRLDKREKLEVAKIYSIIGQMNNDILRGIRPFRSPHHTTSRVGLIGGGSNPSPGEISLAHRGVLFLDEFPEYPRNVLESMRQPLEDGMVTVSRASGTLTFPARFLLLAASNPCPCGYMGHPKKKCVCAPGIISRYKKRLSGPLLDRIDLHIDVPPVEVSELTDEFESERSSIVRARVVQARTIQEKRFKDTSFLFNSEMSSGDVKKYCLLEKEAENMLNKAVETLSLSARAYFKIIKIAQTIADLDRHEGILAEHIAEALQYRAKEL